MAILGRHPPFQATQIAPPRPATSLLRPSETPGLESTAGASAMQTWDEPSKMMT